MIVRSYKRQNISSLCAAAAAALLLAAACGNGMDEHQRRGAAAIGRYGCGSCHTVKGVPGANGLVGPPLTGVGSRQYIAGMLTNTPDNMASWIYDPKAINPKTAMPKIGLSKQDAGDIAAYLHAQ